MSKVSEHLRLGGNKQPRTPFNSSIESRPLHAANLAFYLKSAGRQLDDKDIAALRQAADIISYPEADSEMADGHDRAAYELTMSKLVPVLQDETPAGYSKRLKEETALVALTLRDLAAGNDVDIPGSTAAETFIGLAYDVSRQGYLFKLIADDLMIGDT
jgi:hypothetical protein